VPSEQHDPSIFQQLDLTARYPYPLSFYIKRTIWNAVNPLLFRWSLRKAFRWRRFILRCFGAKLTSTSLVYGSVRIFHPWLLTIGKHTTIAREVDLYNLGPIVIGDHTVISHRATLCAGTHDYSDRRLPLLRPTITVGSGVWIATESFVGPGVTIGNNSIVGARAVVMKDVPAGVIVGGNPARIIKARPMALSAEPVVPTTTDTAS